MYSFRIYDQEMTKEKFDKNKQLQENIKLRKKEISNKLNNIIIKISTCDLYANVLSYYLTVGGYFYKEEHNFNSYDYKIKLIGYLNPINMNNFISYLLEEEQILKRKNISSEEMSNIFDYNLSIDFKYDGKYFDIPDDEFCSNNKISKYKKNRLSSRIVDKLHKLVENPTDLKDYNERKELTNEYTQINKFLDLYDEKKDEIPVFLRKKENK